MEFRLQIGVLNKVLRVNQDKRSKTVTGAEFDSYAACYEELLKRSIKFSGDNPEYFAAYKASYLGRMLPSPTSRVLDYGCGVGMLSRQLKRQFPKLRVDGFDPSGESLSRVDGKLLAQGTFGSDLHSLGSNYDLIIVANVLHHVVPAQRQELISEVSTRLSAGGRLVIFEHNPWNPFLRWAVARCPFDDDAILLPRRETALYVKQAGLSTKHDYIVFFPRWLSFFRRFERLLLRFPLGAQYTVLGQKNSEQDITTEQSVSSNNEVRTSILRD